mmetsp:Transcript_48011/g.82525  ORF Transcript_48011/g.82525 Transcript_48011/m.82525 type:complete len:91 (-) Transcript_48011:791-1063(-)
MLISSTAFLEYILSKIIIINVDNYGTEIDDKDNFHNPTDIRRTKYLYRSPIFFIASQAGLPKYISQAALFRTKYFYRSPTFFSIPNCSIL